MGSEILLIFVLFCVLKEDYSFKGKKLCQIFVSSQSNSVIFILQCAEERDLRVRMAIVSIPRTDVTVMSIAGWEKTN